MQPGSSAALNIADALRAICKEIGTLQWRCAVERDHYYLYNDADSYFDGLVTRARTLLESVLGPHSPFETELYIAINQKSILNFSFTHGRNYVYVKAAGEIIERAADHIEQAGHRPLPSKVATKLAYVNTTRLEELRALKSSEWDFTKLIQLCHELNLAHEHACYCAVAMLLRAIIDHVPPLFGRSGFPQVVANHSGGKSFKDLMSHLENASRKIADGHLHQPIRRKENLPTENQVAFQAPLDALLGEIVRISSAAHEI